MLQLYENIRKRRTELGMSQQELAELVGYTGKSMIAKIESGKVDLSQSKISDLADALRTTPSLLMGWEDSLNEETGSWLADYLEDVELITYVKKVQQASPETRKKIFSMIDLMLGE